MSIELSKNELETLRTLESSSVHRHFDLGRLIHLGLAEERSPWNIRITDTGRKHLAETSAVHVRKTVLA